jgi:hypothetical protein
LLCGFLLNFQKERKKASGIYKKISMSEENKKGFIVEANTVLSRYIGKINEKRVLEEISNELNSVLNNYIAETPMYKDDFPIEFENWMGKFKIESDGSTQYEPKASTKYIEVKMEIKPTDLITDKEMYAVYEKEPAHGSQKDGIIMGPFKTEEEAKEAGDKYGYHGDNYYVNKI